MQCSSRELAKAEAIGADPAHLILAGSNSAPVVGTAGSDILNIPQFRAPDREGDYEPVSDARPPNHQSVEQSLDKVFGEKFLFRT